MADEGSVGAAIARLMAQSIPEPQTDPDRPPLPPEEHCPVPLDSEERERRADMLRRVRDANRRPRGGW